MENKEVNNMDIYAAVRAVPAGAVKAIEGDSKGRISVAMTGTGIGLMVCKNLIDRSDCQISFTSEEMKGTTFTIMLPLAE